MKESPATSEAQVSLMHGTVGVEEGVPGTGGEQREHHHQINRRGPPVQVPPIDDARWNARVVDQEVASVQVTVHHRVALDRWHIGTQAIERVEPGRGAIDHRTSLEYPQSIPKLVSTPVEAQSVESVGG